MLLRTALLFVLFTASVADAAETARARRAFELAQAACTRDAGRLWGVDLCGPILVADPATHEVIANVPGDALRADGGVYTGVLPPAIGIANTAVDWNGRRWTMLRAPLPDDDGALAVLVMHESWHRIQAALGLPAVDGTQAHLDTEDARVALRLELRALRVALSANDADSRAAALADALAQRQSRHAAHAGSAVSEARMELHEGLAEYTGVALAEGAEVRVAQALAAAERQPSFVRSFAYATGPAYGVLLDRQSQDWRRGLAPGADLAALAARAYGIDAARIALPRKAALQRDGQRSVLREERERAIRTQRELVALRERLVDRAVLVVPLDGASVVFDPRELRALPPHGTVYPALRASGAWGTLDVTDGALVAADWSTVRVALDAGMRHLQLNDGWTVKAGPREADRRVVRKATP